MKKQIIQPGTKFNDWEFVQETTERRFKSVVGEWKCLGCLRNYHVANTSVIQGKSKRCVECGHAKRCKPRNLLSIDRKRKLHLLVTEEENEQYRLYRKQEKMKSFQSLKGRTGMLFRQARKRARDKNWKFDLTKEWVMTKLAGGKCEVTGVPFDLTPPIGKYNWYSPSLDRIDPNEGYTKENTQMTIWRYNHVKGIMSSLEFENFCRLVLHLTDSKNVSS